MPKEITKCSECGAKTVMYRHTMNQRMAFTVFRFYEANGPAHYESILRKLGDVSEHKNKANMQKIAYWGLIEKYYEKGVRKKGWWVITDFGIQWVRGQVSIKQWAITYRGVPKDWAGEDIYFKKYHPYEYRQKDDYVSDAIPAGRSSQEELF